jgi:hypothetical protein
MLVLLECCHVGWESKRMVDHYASIGKLVSPVGPASILSKAAENLGRGTSSLDKGSNWPSGFRGVD